MNSHELIRLSYTTFFELPLSYNKSCQHLFELISVFEPKDLLLQLSFIGRELFKNKNNTKAANNKILEKNCIVSDFVETRIKIFLSSEKSYVIFNEEALILLTKILTLKLSGNITPLNKIRKNKTYVWSQGIFTDLHNSSKVAYNDKPIIGIFLLCNQIIDYLEAENLMLLDQGLKSSEYREFYRNVNDDPLYVLTCFLEIHNTQYFHRLLKEQLDLNFNELNSIVSALFILIQKDGATFLKAEDPLRNSLCEIGSKEKNANFLKVISLKFEQRKILTNTDPIEEAHFEKYKNLLTSKYIGKPFIEYEGQLYCPSITYFLRTILDFPYHFVKKLISKEEEGEFNEQHGEAFNKFIENLFCFVCSPELVTVPKALNKKENSLNREDLRVQIDKDTYLLIELKSAKENLLTKQGVKKTAHKQFINIKNRKGKAKGISQIYESAHLFREKTNFSGEIFTIECFYGNFPESEEFDLSIEGYYLQLSEHSIYANNSKNHNLIVLSCSLILKLLCIQKQKPGSLKEILITLSESKPSQIRGILNQYLHKHTLSSSLSFLLADKLKVIYDTFH